MGRRQQQRAAKRKYDALEEENVRKFAGPLRRAFSSLGATKIKKIVRMSSKPQSVDDTKQIWMDAAGYRVARATHGALHRDVARRGGASSC